MALKKRMLLGIFVLIMAITAIYGVRFMQAQEEGMAQVKEYDLDKISNAQADLSRSIGAVRNDLREIKRDLQDIKSAVR